MNNIGKAAVMAGLLLAAASFAGCRKTSVTSADSLVRFTLGSDAARGALINTSGSSIALSSQLGEFWVSAWDGSTLSIPTSSDAARSGNYQKAVHRTQAELKKKIEELYGTGAGDVIDAAQAYWMTVKSNGLDDEYMWQKGVAKTFYAYANLPSSGAAMTAASDGQTLNYTTVSAVSSQKDILLGTASGDGSSSSLVAITFKHPLTAVQFKKGNIPVECVVESLTLSGLATSGSVKMTTSGLGSWSVAAYAGTSTQSQSGGLAINATSGVFGAPFLIVPQNTATKAVTLKVAFTNGITAQTILNIDDWKAGKVNSYKLNYSASLNVSSVSVTDFSDAADVDVFFDN